MNERREGEDTAKHRLRIAAVRVVEEAGDDARAFIMPDPCEDPVMREAPMWAHHLCAELRAMRADVRSLRARLAGATLGGIVAAEILFRLADRFGVLGFIGGAP